MPITIATNARALLQPDHVDLHRHGSSLSYRTFYRCSLKYVSATPHVLLQYHSSCLNTLLDVSSSSTKTQDTCDLCTSLSTTSTTNVASVTLYLDMKPCRCSHMLSSALSPASTALSHNLIVWLINSIAPRLPQFCTTPLFLKIEQLTCQSSGIVPLNIIDRPFWKLSSSHFKPLPVSTDMLSGPTVLPLFAGPLPLLQSLLLPS